ncbi:MAG: hypothetical protein RI894_2669 [Bacteroidota bacterium]|jgi:hypothetical protein
MIDNYLGLKLLALFIKRFFSKSAAYNASF